MASSISRTYLWNSLHSSKNSLYAPEATSSKCSYRFLFPSRRKTLLLSSLLNAEIFCLLLRLSSNFDNDIVNFYRLSLFQLYYTYLRFCRVIKLFSNRASFKFFNFLFIILEVASIDFDRFSYLIPSELLVVRRATINGFDECFNWFFVNFVELISSIAIAAPEEESNLDIVVAWKVTKYRGKERFKTCKNPVSHPLLILCLTRVCNCFNSLRDGINKAESQRKGKYCVEVNPN